MRKTTRSLFVVGLLLQIPIVSSAMGFAVPGSKHDLAVAAESMSSAATCYICHSPRNSLSQKSPLWVSGTSSQQFSQYNSDEEMNYNILSADGGVLICLSCHDGTFAEKSIYIESALHPAEQLDPSWTGKGIGFGEDHPVNIVYFDYEADSEIRPAISDAEVSDGRLSLTLYNGRVQCGSCHDVHNGQGDSFLRISNEGSQLCLVCHLK